jgi:hypothetical protein
MFESGLLADVLLQGIIADQAGLFGSPYVCVKGRRNYARLRKLAAKGGDDGRMF